LEDIMSVIAGLLDNIYDRQVRVGSLKARIRVLAGSLFDEVEVLEDEITRITKEAKVKAEFIPITARHTLKGSALQLVFSETAKWDTDALAALAVKYDIPTSEIGACLVKNHVWSIRNRGRE
jgi:hypothetical protein